MMVAYVPCRFLQTDAQLPVSCFPSSSASRFSAAGPCLSATQTSCNAQPPSFRSCPPSACLQIRAKKTLSSTKLTSCFHLKPWQKDGNSLAVVSEICWIVRPGKTRSSIGQSSSFLPFTLQLSHSHRICELTSQLHPKSQKERNVFCLSSDITWINGVERKKSRSNASLQNLWKEGNACCLSSDISWTNGVGRKKSTSKALPPNLWRGGSLFERLQDECRRFALHGRQARIVVARSILQWNRRPQFVGETPRVVVITSGKGGVGKTTTTANLGLCLARLEFKVIAIDADVGLRNLDLLLGLENRVNYTAVEVLNGDCRLDQALIRDKRWTNLELLCINKPRYKMPIGFGGKALTWLVDALRKRPGGSPDFILIDCPAGIDAGFITAITPANEAILITTPDITSLRDADRVTGLLECDGIKDIKMIVNRVRSDMIKGEDMMSVLDVQEMLGLALLGVIPEDAEVIRSTNRGYPLVLNKPPTLAGLALEQAAWRLVEQDSMKEVPVEEAPVKKGFFKFL